MLIRLAQRSFGHDVRSSEQDYVAPGGRCGRAEATTSSVRRDMRKSPEDLGILKSLNTAPTFFSCVQTGGFYGNDYNPHIFR